VSVSTGESSESLTKGDATLDVVEAVSALSVRSNSKM